MARRKKQTQGYSDFSPRWVKRLWVGFALLLLASLLAEFWLPHKGYFGIDGTPFFYAWFAVGACVLVAVMSNLLGKLLRRPVDYWDDEC